MVKSQKELNELIKMVDQQMHSYKKLLLLHPQLKELIYKKMKLIRESGQIHSIRLPKQDLARIKESLQVTNLHQVLMQRIQQIQQLCRMRWPFTVRIPIKPAIRIRKSVYKGCFSQDINIRGFFLDYKYNTQNQKYQVETTQYLDEQRNDDD